MSEGIAAAIGVISISSALMLTDSTDDRLESLQVVGVSAEDAIGQQTRSFRSGPSENPHHRFERIRPCCRRRFAVS